MTYIYRYVNPRTNEIYYVGKADDLERRDKEHLREEAWCFKFLKLEYIICESNHAFEIEAYYIKTLKPIYNEVRPNSDKYLFELSSYIYSDWTEYNRN